jgi:hypothetical protein
MEDALGNEGGSFGTGRGTDLGDGVDFVNVGGASGGGGADTGGGMEVGE